MFSNNAAAMMSPHRDVLEASIPETEDSKARLVEELKSRAKTCVQQKSWMDAKLLYEKAIAVSDNNEAALQSNLSLVHYSMGKFDDAKEAAEQAVTLDPKYVKGHWRLAQALCKLEDYSKALKVHQTALVQDPTNKAIKKEIDSCKKLQEEKRLKDIAEAEAAAEAQAAAAQAAAENNSEPAEPVKKTTTTSTSTATSKSTTNDEDTKMEVDAVAGEFTKSDHVKGYKIVNGKKTSFFHNEMDEKTKQLIGDIAPKRIEVVPPAASAAPSGGSAWNKAGTWEEKDVTAWAKETIQERLLATLYTLPESSPAPGATCRITAVPKCDGHASFATVRGKKRYIYEFALKVKWEFGVEDDTANGTMTFPDVDGTCELGDGYDLTDWEVKDASSSTLSPLLERFVKSGGLRDEIHHTIDDWVRHFRETY